jgi:hypothetical protein
MDVLQRHQSGGEVAVVVVVRHGLVLWFSGDS